MKMLKSMFIVHMHLKRKYRMDNYIYKDIDYSKLVNYGFDWRDIDILFALDIKKESIQMSINEFHRFINIKNDNGERFFDPISLFMKRMRKFKKWITFLKGGEKIEQKDLPSHIDKKYIRDE